MDVGSSSRFTFSIKGVEDTLRVVRFDGQEGISRPYVFTIDTVCENFDLDLDVILQQPSQLVIHDPDEPRYINGIIHANQISDPIGRFCRYRFELTPKVSLLHYRVNLKIFQNLTADAIIRQVLLNAGLTTDDFTFQITGVLPTRVYCTQYQESDLDFIHRLMAEDGLHYFIKQTNNNCVMVISDSHYSFKPVPVTPELEYKYQAGMETTHYFIRQFYVTAEAQPNTVVFRDYNFEHPRQNLEVKESASDDKSGLNGLEVYQHNVSYQNPTAGKQKAANLIKAYKSVKLTGDGFSNSPHISAGHFFQLQNYDDSRYEHYWLLTGVIHDGIQTQVLEEHDTGRGSSYSNRIIATPRDHQFKTLPLAPKPKIRGSQTAFVTGPKGEEIYCDKYGRIKVQFHWDRDGQYNENSSCWVRVKQNWAGKQWGDLQVPRIGTEVLVKFINGDPDQPIVMGCLYNGRDKPPYKLPDHKTRTTFKTNSTPGGEGFNEIRFEDKKGSEQVFIHAEKDLEVRIKNDKRETIGNERHLVVGNNSYEHTKGNHHQQIDGNQYISIDRDSHTTIGDSLHGKTGRQYMIQAGNEIHIKAGDKVVIDAGVELTLKGGGSFAKLDPSGVAFQGATLKINEGGSAGSGSGVSVKEPSQAAESDKNQPGQPFEPIPPQAAKAPVPLGWQLDSLKLAAQSKTPLVQQCQKQPNGSCPRADCPCERSQA
ncbi:type VI secretion system tip protein VgrG [Endozoicomonas sp. SM1973]|uniref:Type VI secretion system tip protein VgrG n=1 Tax=Spartinivicinus marinus TaxID=2994442 RepID=A0A853I7I2_9GAMM|nr:type VI secretion system tip protein TssI/VgrG [Spartinivicinus marinus]MCX4030320.1 type VI secretion system tip protein TssI/VgrG [Spartinivicinus marinus]NYZ69273.1 type VI secretion system tip protein VgrG [Spartinivicinus marinus]